VNDSTKQLKVVGDGKYRPDDEEGDQGPADLGDSLDSEGDRAGKPDAGYDNEGDRWDPGAQRSPVQLVECVSCQTDGEEERQQGGNQPGGVDYRCQACADDDIGKVPSGVGRVEQRPPVAPAARTSRVVGGSPIGQWINWRLIHQRADPT